MLDFQTCEAARYRRDANFDGKFFTAVKTTKIYCRPVCPVKQPLSKNVVYYPNAPAAEGAGYRPCLRCRPETAPFCPAWNGTKTTVERALKLIAEGYLNNAGVEDLAGRLGLGSRQLSRLFKKHIGASPSQVAKTVRLQAAKRLISDSDLPMAEVAIKVGFQSLRRFNAAFLELYGRSPTQLKRTLRPRPEDPERADLDGR
ncbi:MAG: Ada metal-binding domain-containing protein [Hyphomicrobiales bacterium]